MTKSFFYHLMLIVLVSCNTSKEPEKVSDEKNEATTPSGPAHKPVNEEYSWKGVIDKKIPVFVHYAIHDDFVIGEIVYLKTKAKKPIRLIGRVEDDGRFHLDEYNEKGHVTGVIIGKPTADYFEGRWTNLMDGDLTLSLQWSDTSYKISSVDAGNIYGRYVYDYGEEMPYGEFSIERINDTTAAFQMKAVAMGGEPIVKEIEKDTVTFTGNSFVYAMPESEQCELTVVFYKDVVAVKYTKGDCIEQFGSNVSLDRVYIKER